MQINFLADQPANPEVLALLVRKGETATFPGLTKEEAIFVSIAIERQRFVGDVGASFELFVPADSGVLQIVLLGLGEGDDAAYECAGGALTARLLTSGVRHVVADFSKHSASATAISRFAAAAAQRAWRLDEYHTKLQENAKPALERLSVVAAAPNADREWETYDAITQGVALTRTLVTLPPNILYPQSFVDLVCRCVDGTGVEVNVLGEEDMRRLGMGGLIGVSQGSRREGRMLVLTWQGAEEHDPVLGLVGKGVTFDTGGISIKSPIGMEAMKWDMAGAGAVAGAMYTLALRKARANVVAVMGLVENMPGGNAQRPSDVITTMSGQTVEVINTDAEGRLVLCDCITWLQQMPRVQTIIDVATLTGAVINSLGHEYGGLFANDDSLADNLLAAGRASGDKLWRLPLADAYDKMMDADIADMRNFGPVGVAGAITAAHFLKRFIKKDVKWAHLDIAGMVWSENDGPTWAKGATGYGVRLLNRFIADKFEK